MALFFDKHIQFPRPSGGVRIHHAVEWHSKQAILAVASKNADTDSNGSVSFYIEEGELIDEATIQRSVPAECMQWHPVKRIAVIGWRSGEITVYNDHSREYHEDASQHRSALTVLRWNQSGTRIISGDQNGLLAVWLLDSHGQIQPIRVHQHRLQSAVADCVMLHPPTRRSKVLSQSSLEKVKDPVACFVVTQDGTMLFVNHSGECTELFRLSGPVHTLLMRADMALMAVLTQEMNMSQYSVTYNGKISQIMNAKLSTVNKATDLIWVRSGVLASCSGETVVRFWDFEGGDNYSLEMGGPDNPDEVITCISYSEEKDILAGGTSAGRVLMWRYIVGEDHSLEGADQWEYLTASSLAAPPNQIKWGSDKQLLVANCTSTVQILREHVMAVH